MSGGNMNCPVCNKCFPSCTIETHVNQCIDMETGYKDNTKRQCKRQKTLDNLTGTKRLQQPTSEVVRLVSTTTASRSKTTSSSSCIPPRILVDDAANSVDITNDTNCFKDNSLLNVNKSRISKNNVAPLSDQMRPCSFDEYVGQEAVVGANTVLHKVIDDCNIPSLILWGPPGSGKTSLANVIAKTCKRKGTHKFKTLSATNTGVNDVKKIVEVASNDLKIFNVRTVLFIDEIHRFNKLQQDVFLPHIENGVIILIGATTENPSFSLNNALISRCRVIVLEKLTSNNIEKIILSALQKLNVHLIPTCYCRDSCRNGDLLIDKDAVLFLSNMTDGDARLALNSLQLAVQFKRDRASIEPNSSTHSCNQKSTTDSQNSTAETKLLDSSIITKADIRSGFLSSHQLYSRSGDEHFDSISAFIKSMRGSDENAALYWMCRMLNGGEDPKFIARRMIIFASEDVGLGDAQALPLATSAFEACQKVGMPECGIVLAHCAVYLARAPKSIESYSAYNKAMKFVKEFEGPHPGVPLHLRNSTNKLMNNIDSDKGDGAYLPKQLKNLNFFE